MARRFDPAKKAKKWADKLQGATDDYKAGIQGYQGNPMQDAAAKADTAKQRYNAAIDNGTWAQALNATPVETWRNNATTIGAPRLADGAKKGQPKVNNYLTKAAPVYAANVAEIRSMPNATEADRRQRMLRNLDLMKAMKGIGRR